MEQSFPLEIFRKKRNNFRRIPLFVFTEITRISLNYLLYHTHLSCSLVRNAVYFPKLLVERIVPFDSPTELLLYTVISFSRQADSSSRVRTLSVLENLILGLE